MQAGAQKSPVAEASCQAVPVRATVGASSSAGGITSPATMALMAAVHFAGVFNDSKTVVDRPLKAPPQEVAAAYQQLVLTGMLAERGEERAAQLAVFLERWTEQEGSDMESLASSIPPPPQGWLSKVASPEIRQWAAHLHDTWGLLCRKLSPGVRERPQLHTMLWVPHPCVVPGARFREVYYWDSYWVVKGLLVSGLCDIARHIVDNMIYLIQRYGHVPNGIRTYYLNRSQPPLLSEMVRLVHTASPDMDRLSRALDALLTEHAYWNNPQAPAAKQLTVLGAEGRHFNLSRYCAYWHAPRPESYREDVETAAVAGLGESARAQLWQELASGAESGWDFSSRWLTNGTDLHTIRTTQVIPADLNAFLYQMEGNIASFAEELGRDDVAQQFRQLADARREAINTLMWDAASSQWRDLIISDPSSPGPHPVHHSSVTAASNWVPLFAGAAPAGSTQALQAVEALQHSGLIQEGGLAATTVETGQQWDFPNVWPPLIDMAVVAAETYGGERGAELASRLAQLYLRTAYEAWRQTGNMFEKFNALKVGVAGGGGEYEVVDGFGWTNGVALSFLDKYGWAA